jgi:transcriptional regulator with XRE-family HTH domain
MSDGDSAITPMLQTINDLGAVLAGYTRPTMLEWAELRQHFRQERRRRRLTQKDIAYTGNVDQGAISKIEKDAGYMPSAKTLLGAIYGLGYTHASDFFREIEQLKTAPSGDTRHVFVSHASSQDPHVSAATTTPPPINSPEFRTALRESLLTLHSVIVMLEGAAPAQATPPQPPRHTSHLSRRR